MNRRLRSWLAISCALASCLFGFHRLWARLEGETRRLQPDRMIARMIGADQEHGYSVALDMDDYLEIVIEQQGADVVASLLDPGGAVLLEVDSPGGAAGAERVRMVAERAGTHRLEIALCPDSAAGRYSVRIEHWRRASEPDRHRASATRLFSRAEQLRRQDGDLREAIKLYHEALVFWENLGDAGGQTAVLEKLGRLHERLGEAEQAAACYRRALTLCETPDPHRRRPFLLNKLGELHYRKLGEPRKALDYFRRALAIARDSQNRRREASYLNNLAVLHKSRGEIHEALQHYNQALEIWRALGDPVEASKTLQNLGNLYSMVGQMQRAVDAYLRGLEPLDDAQHPGRKAEILTRLGSAYRRQGHFELALEMLEEALMLPQRPAGRAVTQAEIGTVLVRLDQKARALDVYTKALEVFRSKNQHRRRAWVLASLGWLHDEQGDPAAAAEYYYDAQALFQWLEDRHGEASVLYGRARAERHRDRWAAARTLIEQALEIVESLRAETPSHKLRASYLARRHEYYQFYVDLLMQLHEIEPSAGHDRRAFEAGERARARSLLEVLTESYARIRRGADAELLEQQRSLRSRIRIAERKRSARLAKAPALEEEEDSPIDRELGFLVLELDRVETEIRTSSPRYSALIRPRPLGLPEVQAQVVDAETQLLVYSLGEERSFLWLITPDSLSSHVLPDRAAIEEVARPVAELLQRSHYYGAREQTRLALGRLSQMLLGPVREQLDKKRLVIVSEGALQYIPFGVLPKPSLCNAAVDETGGSPENRQLRPLAVDHEIVHLPSASLLPLLRQEVAGRVEAPRTIAVLANPVFSSDDPRCPARSEPARPAAPPAAHESDSLTGPVPPDAVQVAEPEHLPPLRFSRQVAEEIKRLVPESERLIAVDFAASRDLALGRELGEYRIVHFGTHGRLNSQHPELSGLVLSLVDEQCQPREGFLPLHEIYNLDLPAELVVLSACQTALGGEIRGEGLVGLTRGFLYAGARRVIVSLWRVSDVATAELMTRFYRELLQNRLPPAAALRSAQLSMLAEPRWQAPFHWGGFVLQGDWR